ncbi:MAG TPA: hypothetical protein VK836_18310 [Streptosporangiaceae bacterium]|jgi:hypothetical protein|nr:hypothetical protein [Streptosporangiaceae bacterium]
MNPTIPIPDSDDELELAPTADGFGYTASITRRRSDGSAAWTALPPLGERQDAWTTVQLQGHQVVANTWSAFEVHLDLKTGREIGREFTK